MHQLTTEISRAVHDSSFSMDELFYRYFMDMPLLFCCAGSSDLYDRPACSSDEDEDVEIDPRLGPEELQKAINAFIAFMKERDIHVPTNVSDQVTFVRYVNFPNNVFKTFIVFRDEKVVVQLHVTPSKRETLTSVQVLGALELSPVWVAAEQYCKGFIAPLRDRQDEINIIGMSNNDFYLQSIPLKNRNKEEFSYDHYNENFQAVSERVLDSLQSNNESGLVLFHGDPGTGKTTYLKYLLHTITKKKLIYLPPDLIEHLSAPNFISFMLSQASNSILLIEDAENVLRHREAGGNQAVSNILNISDGILGDVLRLQIVCTFNSALDDIDQALLRPGRLIAEYRFEKLKKDRADLLMRKLYEVPADKAMTLAEVFNYKKMPDKTHRPRQGIGFIPVGD